MYQLWLDANKYRRTLTWFVNTLIQWVSYVNVAWNFVFRKSVWQRHAGQVNSSYNQLTSEHTSSIPDTCLTHTLSNLPSSDNLINISPWPCTWFQVRTVKILPCKANTKTVWSRETYKNLAICDNNDKDHFLDNTSYHGNSTTC